MIDQMTSALGCSLAGLHVLDLSWWLPGPYCTQVLADMGAEVVKIEPPGGDPCRELDWGLFAQVNRGKKSITVDLKTEAGAARLNGLVTGWADVVVEGFRPGTLARRGVDLEEARRSNPSLICVSISGYGAIASRRSHPGHDLTYLAYGGGLGLRSQWDVDPPVRPAIAAADLGAALFAVVGVLGALQVVRSTGKGTVLDVGIAPVVASLAAARAPEVDPNGRWHLSPANDAFRCADGRFLAISIIRGDDAGWERLARAVGDDEWLADGMHLDAERHCRGDDVRQALIELFGTRESGHWLRILRDAGVPAESVRTVGEMLADDELKEINLVQSAGDVTYVGLPIAENGRYGSGDAYVPRLGEHNGDYPPHTPEVKTTARSRPGQEAEQDNLSAT